MLPLLPALKIKPALSLPAFVPFNSTIGLLLYPGCVRASNTKVSVILGRIELGLMLQ